MFIKHALGAAQAASPFGDDVIFHSRVAFNAGRLTISSISMVASASITDAERIVSGSYIV